MYGFGFHFVLPFRSHERLLFHENTSCHLWLPSAQCKYPTTVPAEASPQIKSCGIWREPGIRHRVIATALSFTHTALKITSTCL